jgi:hypothetical protein
MYSLLVLPAQALVIISVKVANCFPSFILHIVPRLWQYSVQGLAFRPIVRQLFLPAKV